MPEKEYTRLEIRLLNCIPLVVILALIFLFAVNFWAGLIVLIILISIGAMYIYYKKILPKKGGLKKPILKDVFYIHDHAIDKEPNPEKFTQWFTKAQLDMEKGNITLAIKKFKQALKYNIKNALTWFNLGVLHANKGLIKQAEMYFFYAQKNAPDSEEVNNHYTRVCNAKRKAEDLFRNLHINPIEKMKQLKCLNCGSRNELIPLLFYKTYTRSESLGFHSETIRKGVDSINLPFCVQCSAKFGNNMPPSLVTFTKYHKPLVRFKGLGSAIPYVDWIAQVFYENEN